MGVGEMRLLGDFGLTFGDGRKKVILKKVGGANTCCM